MRRLPEKNVFIISFVTAWYVELRHKEWRIHPGERMITDQYRIPTWIPNQNKNILINNLIVLKRTTNLANLGDFYGTIAI